MSLTLVIGTKRWSSWSLRPYMALVAAGIPFDEILVALRQIDTKETILQHSPSGKIPLLIDGAVKVWDSLAILEYLAERFPQARLWPEDSAARALARAVSAEMHSGFQALRSTCPMDVVEDHPLAEVPDDVAADVARIESLWGDCRACFGQGGPFLFGAFTNADAMYAPVVTRLRTYGLTVGPVASAYCDAVVAHPAMARWIAEAR
jgi:glutathione S-transferase